jgi:NitT/TauT family transport system permease protein
MIDDRLKVLSKGEQTPALLSERKDAPVSVQQLPVTAVANRLWRHLVASRLTIYSLAIGAFMWELAGRCTGWRFLPPLSRVLRAEIELFASGQIISHLSASILGLLVGYTMAVVFGITLGALMGRYRTVEFVLAPYLNAFLATPKIVLLPVLYSFFGLSRLVQIAVIFLSAFFVIVLNTLRGIQTVEPIYVEMARAFGATERQLFFKVLLPGALPLMMAGLRLAIGHAVKGMVTGEMFITVFGMGALLRTYGGRFDAEKVFAILLVVIIVGLVCSSSVQLLERRLTHWMDSKI